ncbi:hypothetical protein [Yinghuangia sp. YIM S09857]|uniref:hypothetical protein n=1 Tax=Yinghuangia sp. YIM S09857 TaxID=3436929 RepID=UPI003F537B57
MTEQDQHAREMNEQELVAGLTRQAALATALDPRIEESVVVPALRRRRRRARLSVGAALAAAAGSVLVAVAVLGTDKTTDAARGSAGASVAPTHPQEAPTLHELAQAAERVGTASYADVYTNVRTDPCRCSITIYLSNLTRSDAFLTELREAVPHSDGPAVNFAPGKYARPTCHSIFASMSAELRGRHLPFTVFTTGVEVDCTVLRVGVDAVDTARAYLENPGNGFTSRELAVEVQYAGDQSFMDTSARQSGG